MTIHGTGRASLENAMTRAIARYHKQDKIDAWHAKKAHFKRPEYDKAIEDNKRLGIEPVGHRTRKQAALHAQFAYANTMAKRKIAAAAAPPDTERTEAEARMIEALKQAIELLTFHLTALTQIPNPTPRYQNKVNQQAIFDQIDRLAKCAIPALPTNTESVYKPRAVPLTHVCIDCGGPAALRYRGQWYCEDCAP